MKTFFKFSLGLFIGYLIGAVVIFLVQRSMIYNPPQKVLSPQQSGLEAGKIITLSEPFEGHKFWYIKGYPDFPLLMMFHGNGANVHYRAPIFKELADAGYNVIGVEYPGYSANPGKPTQASITAVALAQYDWALAQGYQSKDILLWGNSLGAAVASQVAMQRPVATIVVDAPFDTLTHRAQQNFPIYPAQLLLRDKWDNITALNSQCAPVIWLHGTQDRVIPLKYGQSLFEQLTIQKTSHVIDGGQHTDLWYRGGREIIFDELEKLND